MEETTENYAVNKESETMENIAADVSEKATENVSVSVSEKVMERVVTDISKKITENVTVDNVSQNIKKSHAAKRESEKLDRVEDSSPGFHDFLEDDFLESLAVVDSWKAEDEEIESQENKEKVGSHSRRRSSRDQGDRRDKRSSERNRTDQHRSRRSRNRELPYRRDPYSRYRYSPSPRSGYNDRNPRDNNRSSSKTRITTERYQRRSPDDAKSRRDPTIEHKPEAKIEVKPHASSPAKTLSKTEENAENKVTQDDKASTLVSPPKLSSEQPVAIDTCIKEITDVVPPGTEEEFVNLAKSVGDYPEPEWTRSNHKEVEKNGRRRSPTEYVSRPSEREYRCGDYLKRYGSREREPLRKNRSRSKEMHLPLRSRSRERQLPIKRRSRSRERQTPTIKARSRSRERQLPIKRRSRSKERQTPTIKPRSRSRERQIRAVKRRSRSRERQMPTIKRRSRSRERQMSTIKRRSRSKERQTPTMKRRTQSRERSLDTQKKLRRKREKRSRSRSRSRSPSIKKSWNSEKKGKGTSGRSYSKAKDNYKGIMDHELSPVSGTSLSTSSLSLSPVSSEGERWRRRKSDQYSPLSLSPTRSSISLSSELSDRSPKRKRSPFWKEIQRTFAAQDKAKSRFAKLSPLQQPAYYQNKLPPAQPVTYPTELYPNSTPNYPPLAANYYQPPPVQPPPPGDFVVTHAMVPRATAPPPMMVPPVSAPMMVPPVSAPMMVPPVSAPMMVPPVTQMAPVTYPVPCPVPPPVQPVAPVQLEPQDPSTWQQSITEHAGAPKWEAQHAAAPKWEPEKPTESLKWEPKDNDGATKWEPEKYDPVKSWEPEKHDLPKWEPQKRGKIPKKKARKRSGSSKRDSKRSDDDEELIPPPPPTISQPEKSLSSLLEASAKAGVSQKKQSSVEHNVVTRCEEALRTLSADRGLVLPPSGTFVFHRDNQPPVTQESTSKFQSPLLRKPIPVLDYTEPLTSNLNLFASAFKVKEEGDGKKSSLLMKAAAKLASKGGTALHDEVFSCTKCAEREKKKFVDCSSQTSVASRTVALQCDNIRGEVKAYFETEFDNSALSSYRRYQPLPQPPKGILKSSRH